MFSVKILKFYILLILFNFCDNEKKIETWSQIHSAEKYLPEVNHPDVSLSEIIEVPCLGGERARFELAATIEHTGGAEANFGFKMLS